MAGARDRIGRRTSRDNRRRITIDGSAVGEVFSARFGRPRTDEDKARTAIDGNDLRNEIHADFALFGFQWLRAHGTVFVSDYRNLIGLALFVRVSDRIEGWGRVRPEEAERGGFYHDVIGCVARTN